MLRRGVSEPWGMGLIVPGIGFDSQMCEQAGIEILNGVTDRSLFEHEGVKEVEWDRRSRLVQIGIRLGEIDDNFKREFSSIDRLAEEMIPQNPGSNVLTLNLAYQRNWVPYHRDLRPGRAVTANIYGEGVFYEYPVGGGRRPIAITRLRNGDSMIVDNPEEEHLRSPHAVKNISKGIRVSAVLWHLTDKPLFIDASAAPMTRADINEFVAPLPRPSDWTVEV